MSTTLSALRTRVRRYINEETADRWTDAELTAYVNEGIGFLQSEIDMADDNYFLRAETFTASAGSYQAAFPSDVLGRKVRQLTYYENSSVATGAGQRVPLVQLEWVYDNWVTSGSPRGYYPMAGYLIWAPYLYYASTFRFVYSAKEVTLSNDTDVLSYIRDEHVDMIALYASILALEKIGGDTKGFAQLLERRIQHMKNEVIFSDPVHIPQVAID